MGGGAITSLIKAEGATGGYGGEEMNAPCGCIGEGEAAENFTSWIPSSQYPPNFRMPQNVSNPQPSFSSMQARPPLPLPQQPHPSQTLQHVGSLQWHEYQEQPQSYPHSTIQSLSLQFQNQLQMQSEQTKHEFPAQTLRQVGEQSELANGSIQADRSSPQQIYQRDLNLYQIFSSPEAMQSMLSDRDKLSPFLEPNPVLAQMLQLQNQLEFYQGQQQLHPSQTAQHHHGCFHRQQHQQHPRSYAQSDIQSMTLQLQNQLEFYQEFASQTPRQVGELSQVANQSIQADSSSQKQREPDTTLYQIFSSPEAMQSLLNDHDKLCALLEPNPVLAQMLRDRFNKF